MPVIRNPPSLGKSWLGYIGDYFHSWGNYVGGVSSNIRGVFIIGEYLYEPTRQTGYWLKDRGDNFYGADNYYQYWTKWINGLIEGITFIDLLEWASHHFRNIRNDARNWVLSILNQYSFQATLFVYNPQAWLILFLSKLGWQWQKLLSDPWGFVLDILIDLQGWFIQFWYNPLGWVIGLLQQYMPDILSFLSNPIGYVLQILVNRIVDFWLLLGNPSEWVLRRIYSTFPFLAQLFSNPESYIKTIIAYSFGFNLNFWSNPFYYFLDKLLTELQKQLVPYKNRIKNMVIDFILLFI